MNQLIVAQPQELYRQSTDVASICKEMAVACAVEISGRKYIPVEVWQAIATAHSCVASSRDVQWIEKTEHSAGGFRAIGEIRRMSDGALISTAEGFVGDDEATWFGGEVKYWDKYKKQEATKTLPKRPDYAIRAMCQTRAMSRAGRSAFAHVVVLMNAGLDTAPAEEAEADNFDYSDSAHRARVQKKSADEPEHTTEKTEVTEANWREVLNTAAKPDGKFYKPVGELTTAYLKWFREDPKGTYAYWKSNPKYEDANLRKAIEFAWAAKFQKQENSEINQERQDTEPKTEKPDPAGAVAMFEKMIAGKKANREAVLETAVELGILDNMIDEITDASAYMMIGRFGEILEITEAK